MPESTRLNPAYRKPGKQRDCESQVKEHPSRQLLNLIHDMHNSSTRTISGLTKRSTQTMRVSILRSDKDFMTEEFCNDWVLQLNLGVSLGLFLCFDQLSRTLDIGETKAAALMIGRNKQTIRE